MPIYAPTLPPRPALDSGDPPILVLLRFDLKRVLRLKLGRFFGFAFLLILIIQCTWLYAKHLMGTNPALAQLRPMADQFLPQGAAFQAQLLHPVLVTLLWFQVALVGGGLVARDTLYRIRPLLYAHPVTPLDYLTAKALFAAGLPFLIQLPFILLPWLLSMAIGGLNGPVWPTAPLYLVPSALIIAALMGAVTLGASSMASSPRVGFGWALGIMIGSGALGRVLSAALGGDSRWLALGVGNLTSAWPRIICQAPGGDDMGLGAALLGTAFHLIFWTWLAHRRTRPSEATQ
jgi:ABC-type transport system involved in multi-copper enzyme maturation permease subunit